jgi:hypothetical protein
MVRRMDLWRPPHESEHQLAWWAPLVRASRAARRERIPWPIHVDEFELRGRVDRRSRPSIWIYAHRRGGELALDDTGQPYRFIATPRSAGLGQFRPCAIRRAIWMARLPEVVAPVWYGQVQRADEHQAVAPSRPTLVRPSPVESPAASPEPSTAPADPSPPDDRVRALHGHRSIAHLDLDDHDDEYDDYDDDELPGPPPTGVRRRSHLAVIDGGRMGA